ncbi:hypothetical protein ACFQUU_08530 [Herbaspirillum sp. GCM10030257]|uniref:hypothetical protein n=1 Tax=Herbaspirillum sp. GCM10030257 TaxID=3273393 RepID=UPI003619D66A
MKERPILFSAPMVRALLDGTKTQTRRIVKPQPVLNGHFWELFGAGWSDRITSVPAVPGHSLAANCPYGQPGDRLWVRETWMPDPENDGTWAYTQWAGSKHSPLSDIPKRFQTPEHCIHRASWTGSEMVWTPSIHMPRWASRILLEVTRVRIERLEECSEKDARAEGIHRYEYFWRDCEHPLPDIAYQATKDSKIRYSNPVDAYRELWEQINGAGSWEANPWVWVVEFRRLDSRKPSI